MTMETQNHNMAHPEKEHNKHYYKLLLMSIVSFIAMYILMYSMVDSFANVISNVNQFYMAGLMTMPMIIIEMILMSGMYKNKKLNAFLLCISSIALVAFYIFIRQQTGVSDKQFLKSMIPHHGAAILMVEQASLNDPEIKKLAEGIIKAQQAEIAQMKAKLKELEK
mgnify:CR=1 FL=1